MIKQFERLTTEEQELLYNAPVLVSVLASVSFNEVDHHRKADAIKLAHLRTFTAFPLLLHYYHEVDKNFKERFEAALKKYFPFDDSKRKEIKKEIEKINTIIKKLDKEYAQLLNKSLEKYEKHVKKASHSIFQDFIFPLPMPGL